uniref:mRNA-decapping enzyme 2 n=1 Tax=Hirondellea gigas TaxID=1518452 RepID=A0A6A7FXD0_9CRUS
MMYNRNMDANFKIPVDVINDCVTRFLIDQEPEKLRDNIHLCTYLEQAYWFYIDCHVDEDPEKLFNVPFQIFIKQLMEVTKLPAPGNRSVIEMCNEFSEYKHRVNTYGGALVNPELNKVLLVQSYFGKSWSFPKGKIEQSETSVECAIREVKEEIDYDMTPYINPESVMEQRIWEQMTSLYIIYGVPENTVFKTNTRKEIGVIKWFNIDELPTSRRDKNRSIIIDAQYQANRFYVSIPFILELRKEIRVMKELCLTLFGRPTYRQDEDKYKFLKLYYYKVYEQRLAQDRVSRSEERTRREDREKTLHQASLIQAQTARMQAVEAARE